MDRLTPPFARPSTGAATLDDLLALSDADLVAAVAALGPMALLRTRGRVDRALRVPGAPPRLARVAYVIELRRVQLREARAIDTFGSETDRRGRIDRPWPVVI